MASSSSSSSPWDCQICFSPQTDPGWRCPFGHRYCSDCIRRHAEATTSPQCPFEKCQYKLEEKDLKEVSVSEQRLHDFTSNTFAVAVERLAARRHSRVPDALVRCPNESCGNIVLVSAGNRTQLRCACGHPPFCTRCRQTPYHYHGSCEDVQRCREDWIEWIRGGAARYRGQATAAASHDRQLKALGEQMERYRQLEQDEQWKAANCRTCPSCRRPIQRIEGCTTMKCGQDAHGGNVQPGCGANFDWNAAPPYQASVGAIRRQRVSTEEVRCRGRDVFHRDIRCNICKRAGMQGPRFECLHCKEFNVCLDCQPRLAGSHQADHVFRIHFESNFLQPNMCLPVGTRVRLVRRGGDMPRTSDLQPSHSCITSFRKSAGGSSHAPFGLPQHAPQMPPMPPGPFAPPSRLPPGVAAPQMHPVMPRFPGVAPPHMHPAALARPGGRFPPGVAPPQMHAAASAPPGDRPSSTQPVTWTPQEGDPGTVVGWLPPGSRELETINHFEWKSSSGWKPYSPQVNDHIFRTAKQGEHIVPITLEADSDNPLKLELNLLTLTQRNRQSRGTRDVRAVLRHPTCKYFAKGYCHLGDECGYRHVKESETGWVRHVIRFDSPPSTSSAPTAASYEVVVASRFLEPVLGSAEEAHALATKISKQR